MAEKSAERPPLGYLLATHGVGARDPAATALSPPGTAAAVSLGRRPRATSVSVASEPRALGWMALEPLAQGHFIFKLRPPLRQPLAALAGLGVPWRARLRGHSSHGRFLTAVLRPPQGTTGPRPPCSRPGARWKRALHRHVLPCQ